MLNEFVAHTARARARGGAGDRTLTARGTDSARRSEPGPDVHTHVRYMHKYLVQVSAIDRCVWKSLRLCHLIKERRARAGAPVQLEAGEVDPVITVLFPSAALPAVASHAAAREVLPRLASTWLGLGLGLGPGLRSGLGLGLGLGFHVWPPPRLQATTWSTVVAGAPQ